jgi:hypothetical protein
MKGQTVFRNCFQRNLHGFSCEISLSVGTIYASAEPYNSTKRLIFTGPGLYISFSSCHFFCYIVVISGDCRLLLDSEYDSPRGTRAPMRRSLGAVQHHVPCILSTFKAAQAALMVLAHALQRAPSVAAHVLCGGNGFFLKIVFINDVDLLGCKVTTQPAEKAAAAFHRATVGRFTNISFFIFITILSQNFLHPLF